MNDYPDRVSRIKACRWTVSSRSPSRRSHPPLVRKNAKGQIVASPILRHSSLRAADHEMLRASSRCIERKNGLLAPWQRCRHPTQSTSRCGLASLASLDQSPQLRESKHTFRLKRKKRVPELQLTAYEFEHKKTGAEYLHVARDDKNNVFSIGFKTNPPDHTGVPHILEHTTLCGSQKYVR